MTPYTTFPSVTFDEDDVVQEMALFQLETGRLPRRAFIRHRLARVLGGTSVSYEDPEALDQLAIPFIVAEPSEPLSDDDLTALLQWSSEQSFEAQIQVDIVLGFEEGDPEEALLQLLKMIRPRRRKSKVVTAEETTKAPEKAGKALAANTRRLIRELLSSSGPMPRDLIVEELHPVIASVYQCRRPSAAIRQALRSMTKAGALSFDEATSTFALKETN